MDSARPPGFFGVVARRQSYVNILYLLLGLPLGTAYFVFLVTGLSLGFGLLITWLGIPVLLLTLGGSWALCQFERRFTEVMLNESIPVAVRPPALGGLWPRLKSHLSDRLTWTGMVYLLLRFPLGIATFTVAVTLVAVTLALLLAPAYMWTSDDLKIGSTSYDPYPWAWLLMVLGIPMVFISLNAMNELATGSGRLARVMLARLGPGASESDEGPSSALFADAAGWYRGSGSRLILQRVFYGHAGLYVVVLLLLLLIDLVTGGGWWVYWPAIGWGAGLALHAVAMLTLGLFGPERRHTFG